MHPAAPYTRIALGLLCSLVCASNASAQTSAYVAGAGFADVRLFGGTGSQTAFGADYSRDATAAGGSIRVGTWVHPRWTLEVGADLASETSTKFRGPVIAIFPPVPALEITSKTRFASVTTMVGFHAPAGRRVRMGYRAGFSFVRARYETELPLPSLPYFTYGDLSGILGSTIFQFPRSSLALPSGALENVRNHGALTLGVEAAINVTPKIAVVPELRASTLSGVFLIRPGVGARWSF